MMLDYAITENALLSVSKLKKIKGALKNIEDSCQTEEIKKHATSICNSLMCAGSLDEYNSLFEQAKKMGFDKSVNYNICSKLENGIELLSVASSSDNSIPMKRLVNFLFFRCTLMDAHIHFTTDLIQTMSCSQDEKDKIIPIVMAMSDELWTSVPKLDDQVRQLLDQGISFICDAENTLDKILSEQLPFLMQCLYIGNGAITCSILECQWDDFYEFVKTVFFCIACDKPHPVDQAMREILFSLNLSKEVVDHFFPLAADDE
jgi:hypothetical protein